MSGEMRPLGRPVEFNRDTVVDRAVHLFWERGFEHTSLDQIEQVIGISRSTLYSSFGGKDGLYASAREQYQRQIEQRMVEPLRTGHRGLEDVIDFFERLRDTLTDDSLPDGCMVVGAMSDERGDARTASYLETFRDGLSQALERASNLGEIAPDDVTSLSTVLVTQLVGLSLLDSSGVVDTREHLDGTLALLRRLHDAVRHGRSETS